MSTQRITTFTPSAANGERGFVAAFPQNPMDISDAAGRTKRIWGYLIVTNESPVSMQWLVNGQQITISPWQKERIVLGQHTDQITYSVDFTLTNSSSAPVNTCIVDGYSADEPVSDQYPIPLVRSTSTVTTSFQAQELLALSGNNVVYPDDESVASQVDLIPNQYPSPINAKLDMAMAAKTAAGTYQRLFKSDVANLQFILQMALVFQNAGSVVIKGMQLITGNGAGTFSHTLGVTPQFVWLCPTQVAEAFAVGGYTSTTFTVSGITSTHQWIAIAIA